MHILILSFLLETYRDRSAERRKENPGGCATDYQPIGMSLFFIPF